MKKTHKQSVIAFLTAVSALAQAEPARPADRPGGHGPPLMNLFALFDTDRNGRLSAAEIEGAVAKLSALDRDDDGEVTLEEIRPKPPAEDDDGDHPRHGGKRPAPPILAALDTDRDGFISEEERKKASKSLEKLDTNEDGDISPDELHPR